MLNLWFFLLYQPLVNVLIFFYKIFGNNLGLAIVFLTLLVRFLTTPLIRPQIEAAKKMREIAPQLEKLKRKYKNDKQKLAKAQVELYKNVGINPAAGCLPQVVQIFVLIALFQAFNQVLKTDGLQAIEKLNQVIYPQLKLDRKSSLNFKFLWLDLTKPDIIKIPNFPSLPGVFLLLSVITQFFLSKQMTNQTNVSKIAAKETKGKEDDFTVAMQTQMNYMLPLMTLIFGYSFPSGLVLYWLVFSLYSLVQQYYLFKSNPK